MITGRLWYKAFKKVVAEFFDWKGIAKRGFVTQVWKEAMEKFHEAIDYEVKTELSDIDVTVFDKEHSEAQIAIELQHDKKAVMVRDIPKLACSNAKLKILLMKLLESDDIADYKGKILGFWQKRSARVKNDELLLIIPVLRPDRGNYWYHRIEAYLSKNSKDWKKLTTIVI